MSEDDKEKAENTENLADSLELQLEEYKDKYFRLLAETENARRRLQKEKQEMTRFAVEQVLAEMIQPIDTLEKALGFTDQMGEETRNWARGFQMILSQFKDVLQNNGVAPFSSMGELFDPHKHEAVEVEETTKHAAGTILQEFVKGYKHGERIIRPARVKVAKAPSTNNEESIQNQTKE